MTPRPMTTKEALNPRNTDNQEFKKTEQVVDRQATTAHNINDTYMRNPPHNIEPGMEREQQRGVYTKVVDEAPRDLGPNGFDAPAGRAKQQDVEADLVNND